MIPVTYLHPRANSDHVGEIPYFFSVHDPRPAKDQLNERYAHGGGWHPYGGDEWSLDTKTMALTFPGDQTYVPLAKMVLRDETIYVYQYAITMILQADGTYEVSRLD